MFDFENILCYRAFTELYIDIDKKNYKPCCHFDPKKSIIYNGMVDFHETVRNDNLKNNWSSGCENCKYAEENKGVSHRLNCLNKPDHKLIFENKFLLKHLELRLDNTCNLACITCDSASSSRWAQEDTRMYEKNLSKNAKVDYDWIFDEKLWENVESLVLYGGEPFYSKKLKNILYWLIKNKFSANIKIFFYTNGTIFNEELIELLRNFKSVCIGVSIDGVGENFEIIRWPAKWDEVLNNINKIKEIENSEIYITYTVSVLNIFNLKNDYYFLKNISNNISFNFLIEPNYYNIKNLPEKFKINLINDLKKDKIFLEVIKKIVKDGNNEVLKECFNRLKILDRYRNTHSNVLFPTNFVNYLLDNTL